MSPRPARIAAALALAWLAGCTVGPDYVPSVVLAPHRWGAEPTDVASHTYGGAIDIAWWNSFDDPILSSLVRRLARQNLDLQAAAERIGQAEAIRDVAVAQGLPQFNAQSSVMHTRQSPNGFVSLVQPSPNSTLTYDLWRNALSASWELDLFGRVRRSVEAARANTQVAIEARHELALEAISELAQDYMQLRGTQARIAIAHADLALASQNLALVRQRFADGVATTLDTAQAEAQRATIEATLPGLQSTAAQLINAIGLLLAEPPRALAAELGPPETLPPLPPRVPVGLPGDVVRQRPDVREAEARLHAAVASEGVAIAAFYPDVTLTGTFDTEGLRLANAFSLPSRAFSVGPTIDLPLFEAGRLTGTLHLRRSQQREAALQFRNTVLQAWRDVDNALTAYAQTQRQSAAIGEAVRQDRIALDAARQRYRQGAIDFLNVISAQDALLRNEDSQVQNREQTRLALVALYRALGGGWSAADGVQASAG